jgi:iron complex outermembrane receptor protein
VTPRFPHFRPSAIALALSALAGLAAAQQSAGPAAAADDGPAAARRDQPQTVTVTATRRTERLQDVPLAVSAATAEQIQNAGVVNIQDISKVVSGVTFGNSPNDAGFRVRGVGTLGGFTSSSEQPVGVVIDGVVMGLGPVLESMVDVERLEALKGPQGTQFGKNASSGVVSIATRKPVLGKLGGEASASVGSANERDLNGTLNLPLGTNAAARISVFDRSYDGYIDNVTRHETWGGQKASGARAKLLFKPLAELDILLSADTTRLRTDGPLELWTVRTPAPGTASVLSGLGVVPGADNTRSAENAQGYFRTNADGASAELNYRLGDYTLTSVSAHRSRDGNKRYGLDASPASVFEGGGHFSYKQDSQELRVTSPRGRFEYVAGAFWSQLKSASADSAWLQPAALGAPVPAGVFVSVTSGINRTSTQSDSKALFGDGKLRLSDTVSLLGGLRWTRDKVDASNVADADGVATSEVGNPPGFLVPAAGRTADSGSTSASKASGRLGAEWKASKDALFYGTVAQGYLGPTITFSGQTGTRSNVKAQTVDDITLGFKTEWLNRRLTVNGSVFYDHYKNLQLGVFRAATNEFITENAGAMTSKGVEVDASARLGGGWGARASFTYADAKFNDYVTQCPTTGDAARCYTPAGTTTALYQAAGDSVPGAPKLTSTLGVDYGTSVGGEYGLDGSVSVSHRSKTSYGVGETAYVQDGYALVNAALKLSPESERWHVALWARNLFDKHYQSAIIGQPFAAPGGVVNWVTRDARRALGVTVGAKF